MAIQNPRKLFTLLGIVVWGDLGEITIYKSRFKRLVYFPKTYPKKPPSPLQKHHRERLTRIAKRWKELPPDAKLAWTTLAKRLSLRMTGYNLWQHAQTTIDKQHLLTLQRQANIRLPE